MVGCLLPSGGQGSAGERPERDRWAVVRMGGVDRPAFSVDAHLVARKGIISRGPGTAPPAWAEAQSCAKRSLATKLLPIAHPPPPFSEGTLRVAQEHHCTVGRIPPPVACAGETEIHFSVLNCNGATNKVIGSRPLTIHNAFVWEN